VLARLSLYDWILSSGITLLLLAAASLALVRLLRALFGNRLAILGLLAVYLFTPLTLPGLSFWDTSLYWLPLQLAIFMAFAAHIKYMRTERLRHAIAATAWIGVGMLFDEPGLLVPFLLFGVTSAFLVPGRWSSAAAETLRRYRRAWAMYGALAALYLAVFITQLQSSVQQPGRPGLFSGVLTFVWTLVRVSFIPGALGGPWHWYAVGPYGFAVSVPFLTQISWAVAGLIVLASLWYRHHAWRAWVMLIGWLALADMLPVILARVGVLSPAFLGMDLHYLADSVPVLVICLGLAFLPVVGEEDPYRAALPPRLLSAAVAGVLACCFLAGSFWSGVTYREGTSAAAANVSSYIATATAAVKQGAKQLPAGAAIVSAPVPPNVMDSTLLGEAAYTESVIGPLVPSGSKLSWTTQQPAGAPPDLMIFDSLGRLLPAIDAGSTTVPPRADKGCWPVSTQPVSIGVWAPYKWIWTAKMHYSGLATTLQFSFDGVARDVAVPAGEHDVYFPATGTGSLAKLTSLTSGASGCVSRVTMGNLVPSPTAYPMPFYPVP
jgi:hypothetical protein